MDVPTWVWVLTIGAIVAMLLIDLFGHVRTPHAPTFRESASWSIAYVVVGLGFGLLVLWGWGGEYSAQYYAGYLTEKSLSVDNLFVFLLIMGAFAVPRIYQQKVLLIGIILALVLRTAFILVGAAAVNAWAWIFYVFGAFLIWTAISQLRSGGEHGEEPKVVGLVRRVLRTTDDYRGDRMVVREKGRLWVTPMFVVMLAIGAADVLFAVDSIPAIFGLTQETYLIFAANAFSLLGLRQLYFLIDGLLDRLVYLNYGLAAILAFIGVKLVIHALHENSVWFINGGEPVHAIPEVSIMVSLIFILGTLVITTVASLVASGRGARVDLPAEAKEAPEPDLEPDEELSRVRRHEPGERPEPRRVEGPGDGG